MFNLNDLYYAAQVLHVNFDKFTPEEFLDGMNVELEHGLISLSTNVINNDIIMTAKIALAHLNEFPNYYNPDYGLRKFEEFLKSNLERQI